MTTTEDFVDRHRELGSAEEATVRRRYRWMPAGRSADLLTAGVYLAAALYVTSSLWIGLRDRVAAGYGEQDQVLMEWFLAHAAHAVAHLQNPLYTHQMDVPFGVNMAAQTNVLGLGLPMTPVTLLFGPRVSFVALVMLGLAGTAYAWYHVLSRYVVSSRAAAFVGGAFCGFAPGMISESRGHLHIISQFLTPFIALYVVRLTEPGRWRRHGIILGVLMAYQVLISEEILFFTGLGVGLFIVVYVLLRPSVLAGFRQFAAGAAVALGVAAVILAIPLYKQFAGAQHYRGLPFPPSLIYVDLASYSAFPSNSLAGDVTTAARLAHTSAEETSFFGWPMVLVVLVLAGWLWLRKVTVARATAITGLTFAVLSLGYHIMINGRSTVPGPFRIIGELPLFDLVVSARLALVVVPTVGVLLAIAADRALARAPGSTRWPAVRRYLVVGAIALAAVPILPLPLPTTRVPVPPTFITAGHWRQYVPAGRTLVTVPTTSSFFLDGMRWASATNLEFAIPRGYFLGPNSNPSSPPLYGAVPTWTSIVLDQVALTGSARPKQDGDDALFLHDLKMWHAAILVLSDQQANAPALLTTVEQFLGPPQLVDDVWVWDVRRLVDGR